MKKGISHWTNRWLSLGGRLILVKSGMENILVYWMSLEKIPKSILNMIRNIIFTFLWSVNQEKRNFHLVSWERLETPKKLGVWGIKNISLFENALVAKTLWRVLFKLGLWSEVIRRKYLKYRSVTQWIKGMNTTQKGISNIWNYMINSFHVLNDWMVWKPGNGHQIKVGEDPLIGFESFYILSNGLVNFLHDKGIYFLVQVSRVLDNDSLLQNWQFATKLGLIGDYQEEWKNYITGLNSCCFKLTKEEDQLLWS